MALRLVTTVGAGYSHLWPVRQQLPCFLDLGVVEAFNLLLVCAPELAKEGIGTDGRSTAWSAYTHCARLTSKVIQVRKNFGSKISRLEVEQPSNYHIPTLTSCVLSSELQPKHMHLKLFKEEGHGRPATSCQGFQYLASACRYTDSHDHKRWKWN